eukprot:CAMPEP_0115540828 /NCGR_PEP_ID=MMETSP0271-20121206/90145_1 /TAXON_ID=71861 /ORGANISM="Scrippsiella trochoidea, Strain CCMP3099" /LENGTH=40 /DNA_ID= /DNA_START= /DNA_END= /DNA_ORIENTATION=
MSARPSSSTSASKSRCGIMLVEKAWSAGNCLASGSARVGV